MNRPLRIVRLANFVTPVSGGLRTALRELGAGYRAAGHEPVLVVPGPRYADTREDQGRVITLPGPRVPGADGYRVLADRRRVERLLAGLAPDRLEVSDRTTLRWTGGWARRARIPAVMVSHESVDGLLAAWGSPGGPARWAADLLNVRTAHAYRRVVCTTDWAAREFERVGARNVLRAPLGVDLERCHPDRRSTRLRALHAPAPGTVLLALCSRLHPEKRPGRALDALAVLRRRGVPARLVVAGDGPLLRRLRQRADAERLPVTFLGQVSQATELARLQATADVVLAPGPAETFGLSALEALAAGTPVVVNAHSALPALVGTAGAVAADTGRSYADAVQRLLARPEDERRGAARRRAEAYTWSASTAAFLAAHDAPSPLRTGPAAPAAAATRPSCPAASTPRYPAAGIEGAAPGRSPFDVPVPLDGIRPLTG